MRYFLIFISLLIFYEPALAQKDKSNEIMEYRAVRDPVTGEITLQPSNNNDTIKPWENLDTEDSKLSFEADPESSYAYFDKKGKLVGVFSMPRTETDKDYLLETVEEGGSLKKVAFWNNTPKLPTREEAKDITEASINATLDVICNSEPKPESMKVEVEIAAALGFEGRFAVTMDWRPARDCDGQ